MGIIKGVLSISTAPLAGDGGPGTVFTPIGYTFRDSETSVTTADPTENDLMSNESDLPLATTITPGTTTVAYSLIPFNADDMIANLGGTKAGTSPVVYSSADTIPQRDVTLKIVARQGGTLTFNKVTLSAKLNYNMGPDSLLLVDISGKVLQPTKAGTPVFTISYA